MEVDGLYLFRLSAVLREKLLVAQRTLAKYAQMLFGQKTERRRLPGRPEELTGNLFKQEMDPDEQARLDREAERSVAGQDRLVHVAAHDRKAFRIASLPPAPLHKCMADASLLATS